MIIWLKRILLTLPFAVAACLTAMMTFHRHFTMRPEHLAGYAFLFGSPWAWLLDHNWYGGAHAEWFEHFIIYMTILWVPAMLYTACIWLLLKGIAHVTTRRSGAGSQ